MREREDSDRERNWREIEKRRDINREIFLLISKLFSLFTIVQPNCKEDKTVLRCWDCNFKVHVDFNSSPLYPCPHLNKIILNVESYQISYALNCSSQKCQTQIHFINFYCMRFHHDSFLCRRIGLYVTLGMAKQLYNYVCTPFGYSLKNQW